MQNNEDNNFAIDDEVTTPVEQEQPEFAQVDPLQVEKELTEQFVDMQKNMQPEDVAAHFFQMFYPHYKQYLSTLSNKDLRRVAEHVVQFPLEDSNPSFHSQNAKNAFELGLRLNDCKMIMRNVIEMERMVAAQQATDEQKAKLEAEQVTNTEVAQTTETVQIGEQTNG